MTQRDPELNKEGERTFRDGDVLKQQDDGGNRELRAKGGDESRVDIRGPDVLESARNRAQNLDWGFAFGVEPVTAVKPGGKGEDYHDKGIP